jgi:hypothetical protein
VSINKPFHHLVRKHYDAWLNKETILTPGGKIERATSSIEEWIPEAWEEVPVCIIPKPF